MIEEQNHGRIQCLIAMERKNGNLLIKRNAYRFYKLEEL